MQLDWNRQDVTRGRQVVRAIDVHAAGEPLRIVIEGGPELVGETMLARRRMMAEKFDHLRRGLIHEPRGHFDMYGCLVTPPVSAEADIGVLFMHNAGYSTMCGHGIIALVTALLETGALPITDEQTPVGIDTPAGLVRAVGHIGAEGRVERVLFLNVPSFVIALDVTLDIVGVGPVTLDIAFGGAFYAVLDCEQIGMRVAPANKRLLVGAATAIKQAVIDHVPIHHPTEDDLGFLYGVIIVDRPEDPSHHSRNLCVFADAEVDRSPTGTGVSARLALLHTKGEIQLNQTITIESILGRASTFDGRVVEETQVGPHSAIVPEISGRAFITGRHEFILDPADKLGQGFVL